MGAFLAHVVGYSTCEEIIAFIAFTYYTLYYLLADGAGAIRASQKDALSELKQEKSDQNSVVQDRASTFQDSEIN